MESPFGRSIAFGPYRLYPAARVIEKEGEPLPVGSRALDILIVLADRAGEVISHRELTERVWRSLVVTPTNLRVHVANLRRALGEGDGEARYIANVPGQGYCFVAPVRRADPDDAPAPKPAVEARRSLPPALARMVGRDGALRALVAELAAHRFVTIVGAGGLGKTTLAVAAAHASSERFGGRVCFVDLAALEDAALVAETAASALGLPTAPADARSGLVAALRRERLLLVLDNCEHVAEAAAALAEELFREAPGVHVLATSREALRAEGEHLHALHPLATPPAELHLAPRQLLMYPAVRHFVERAAASGCRMPLNDGEVRIVAGICERLDGVALAIEIAAGRAGAHGIEGTAQLLGRHFGLNWKGRRTAQPRHQTLSALLDWSWALLGERERAVARRLSVFVGAFSLDAALSVAADAQLDAQAVEEGVDELVRKSLLGTAVQGGVASLRFAGTTRLYAARRLDASGERDAVAQRHARYFAGYLERISQGRLEPCLEPRTEAGPQHMGNVRAALEWCFGDEGARTPLAVALAAAAGPALIDYSLLGECYRWSAAALARLDDDQRGGAREMLLQEALAICAMWTRVDHGEVRAALSRGLEIAQRLDDVPHQLRLLSGLHVHLVRLGDYAASLQAAEQMAGVAACTSDVSCSVMADFLRGSSYHHLGDQAAARRCLEAALARGAARRSQQFRLDYRVRALVSLARVLWVSGCADQAMRAAREALDEAQRTRSAVNECYSMLHTAPVFIWCGEHAAAADLLERLFEHPDWSALPALHAPAHALRGAWRVAVGEARDGVALLEPALARMRADHDEVLAGFARSALAQGLASLGAFDAGLAAIDVALDAAQRGGESAELAELLRVRAEIVLAMPARDQAQAEALIERSMACARRQSALAWELRTAMTRAALLASQGRRPQARELLGALRSRFDEGLGTQDLRRADALYASLAGAAERR